MPISQVTQVTLQPVPLESPLVVLAWGRHLERRLQIQWISTLWGLECASAVAVPGRRTGEAFLRVRRAGSLWILSSLLLIPGWETAETAQPHQRVRPVL